MKHIQNSSDFFEMGGKRYSSLYFIFKEMEEHDKVYGDSQNKKCWRSVMILGSLKKEMYPELHFVLGESDFLKNLGKKNT